MTLIHAYFCSGGTLAQTNLNATDDYPDMIRGFGGWKKVDWKLMEFFSVIFSDKDRPIGIEGYLSNPAEYDALAFFGSNLVTTNCKNGKFEIRWMKGARREYREYSEFFYDGLYTHENRLGALFDPSAFEADFNSLALLEREVTHPEVIAVV